jgi:hypothetical protein
MKNNTREYLKNKRQENLKKYDEMEAYYLRAGDKSFETS